jgi:hypothetical protein
LLLLRLNPPIRLTGKPLPAARCHSALPPPQQRLSRGGPTLGNGPGFLDCGSAACFGKRCVDKSLDRFSKFIEARSRGIEVKALHEGLPLKGLLLVRMEFGCERQRSSGRQRIAPALKSCKPSYSAPERMRSACIPSTSNSTPSKASTGQTSRIARATADRSLEPLPSRSGPWWDDGFAPSRRETELPP